MKKLGLLGVGIVMLGLVGFIWYGRKDNSQKVSTPARENVVFDPQTNAEGSVTIEVTPQITADSFRFDVTMDTHSGDLADDLTKLAMLRDDTGKEYTPIGWEGDPPGGHHRTGTLEFPVISPWPASIELVIQDIDGVEERKFIWNLKEE